MECIAKKQAEKCIDKLWSEIDTDIKDSLIEIINKDYESWKKKEGIIKFGDMPFEIEARIIPEGREMVPRPYKVSRMKLKGNLDEYYYKTINNIKNDNYELEGYNFTGIKIFLKFLIDNLEAEHLMNLCENTKEQFEWILCDVIDSVKSGNTNFFELIWLHTYNSKNTRIDLMVKNNQITFK